MLEGLSKELLIEYGQIARGFLENPVIDSIFQRCVDRWLSEIVGSEWDAAATRESAYQKIRVLRELQGEMVSLVLAAEAETEADQTTH
jgi:hypothetical protein